MEKEIKFAYLNSSMTQFGESNVWHVNIGDYIQFYAIREFLKFIGIEEERILGLSIEQLREWDKEDIILVETGCFLVHDLSPKVHVVYIGWTDFGFHNQTEDELYFLRNQEVIGCRDEYADSYLKALGINSYMNGCLTITMQKKESKLGKNIYIVDAPVEVLEEMPEELKSKAIIKTHEYYFDGRPSDEKIKELVETQYREYYDNAQLVITSRLHLAAPCVAWGIPVILVRKTPFITFSWLDKYIPIYTPETYGQIDWSPSVLNIEREKKMILRDMSYLVTKKYYSLQSEIDTHRWYSQREFRPRGGYYGDLVEGAMQYCKEHWTDSEQITYILWGITHNAEILYQYIKENYKNAKCIAAVDTYKNIDFYGMQTVPPEKADFDGAYVFVIPTGAVQAAKAYLKQKKQKDIYYVTETFITYEDLRPNGADDQIPRNH